MAKTYGSTYLYNKFPYEEKLFKFIMSGQQISTVDDKFEDVKYEFKKRTPSAALTKILVSKNVILMVAKDNVPLNKQFRVFCSKDPKSKSPDLKVFVDCTGLIVLDESTGNYRCRQIDILISHIINAMVCMIYHKAEKQLMNPTIIQLSMEAFSSLFTHIIDYLYKISTIPSTKNKCKYLACMYFIENILGLEFNNNYKAIAAKIVDLSEREQDMIIVQIDDDDFINIKFFIEKLSEMIQVPALKVDNVVDKWMYLYGTNTPFALEYFPALSAMITDAYEGAYINNQKTIEKVVGNTLVQYTKTVIDKGGMLV